MLSESDLYERWRNRWGDFLEDVDEAAGDDRVADALRDKVIIGNAERKIAEGHEQRRRGTEGSDALRSRRASLNDPLTTHRWTVYCCRLRSRIRITGSTGDRWTCIHPGAAESRDTRPVVFRCTIIPR